MNHVEIDNCILTFIDDGLSIGSYTNSITGNYITINLPAISKGYARNDSESLTDIKHITEDMIIEDFCYTLEHEFIHLLHDEIEGINPTEKGAIETEYIAYYMCGSGHNGFFHKFYNIPKNIGWEKTIERVT